MISRASLTTLIAFLLLVCSCEYSIDESNFKDIDPAKTPTTGEVHLVGYHRDTLWIWENRVINVELKDSDLTPIMFTIEGEGIFAAPDPDHPGFFTIYPNFSEEGIHNIIVSVITHSGSSSIADKLGVEGWIIQKEYTVIITREPPVAEHIGLFYEINETGYLEVHWNKYTGNDFHSYTLHFGQPEFTITIRDPDKNSYVYRDFFGFQTYATLDLTAVREIMFVQISDTLQMKYYEPYLHYHTSSDKLNISWQEFPIPVLYSLKCRDQMVMSFKTVTSFTMDKPKPENSNPFSIDITIYFSPIGSNNLDDNRTLSYTHRIYISW